jgi:hypothetical protein
MSSDPFPLDAAETPAKSGHTVRYGCLGVVLLICILWGGCRATSFIKWSEGDREGKLIKFSYKGFPVGHYEGDLSTGALGRNNSGTDNSMIWHFSVNDKAVATELQEALGEEVVIHYNQYMAKGMWNDTDYIATKVKRKGR